MTQLDTKLKREFRLRKSQLELGFELTTTLRTVRETKKLSKTLSSWTVQLHQSESIFL